MIDLKFISKKRTCHLVDFAVLANHNENEIELNAGQILGSFQRTEKAMENKGNGNSNCDWNPWNGSQRPGKKTRRTRDQSKHWSSANLC